MKYTGTITAYFQSKKYGFITSDADGISRFFHETNCVNPPPQVGMKVEFTIGAPNRLGKEPQCLDVLAYGWVSEEAFRAAEQLAAVSTTLPGAKS